VSRLKDARMARGWSQTRAVAELRARARSMGVTLPGPGSLKTQLSRWENGHRTPDDFYRGLLEKIYETSAADLEIVGRGHLNGLELGRTWAETVAAATQLCEDDMNRRELLQAATFTAAAIASPAFQALVHVPTDGPERIRGRVVVGERDVQTIRDMRAGLASIDNRYGGGQIRSTAANFLARDVIPLLRDGRFDVATGRSLFSAAAELAHLVGWMSHDVGAHGMGQRYLIQALGLAQAADDQALMGEILAAQSHQATYLGYGSEAVDLAQAAGQIADRRGIAALKAECRVMAAHGRASLGEGRQCAAALHAAELALDQADRTSEPHWIGYFDESYMAAKFGHCFRALGDNANAVEFAKRSLNMDGQRYARGRAFNLTLLAHSHAQAGQVDAACSVGQEAVAATRELRSDRALNYLGGLSRSLMPAGDSPTVHDLDDAIASLQAA
jgi:transcriptional regulator with XRE-family HTH domain